MHSLVGQRLSERYEIQALVGQGGMGIVYRGYDVVLQRTVAIKVLPQEFTYDRRFVERFRQEAVTAAGLHHANIVTIHDVGEHNGVYFIVMQFLEGVTLDQWLASQGALSLAQCYHVIRQVADALDYAHAQGVIHRDVKPSNIMVDPNGKVTLMDFGLVRAMEGGGLTRTGMIVGTPEYMAPEQALGHPIDGRSDIYSLGVVIYRMLTGEVPFARSSSIAVAYAHVHEPPPPLREKRPEIPRAVEAVVLKALAKQPQERYQTAGQLVLDFAEALSGKMPAGVKLAPLPRARSQTSPPEKVPSGPRPASVSPRPSSKPEVRGVAMGEAPTRLATPVTSSSLPSSDPNAALPPSSVTPPKRRFPLIWTFGSAVLLLIGLGAIFALTGGGSRDGSGSTGSSLSTPSELPTSSSPLVATESGTPTLPPDAVALASTAGLVLPSPSPTSTPTYTQEPTATPTPSHTPTPTYTATVTPTSTPTATPTISPTSTPTRTPSPTPTSTPSPVLSVATLEQPPEGATVSGVVQFVWRWPGPELGPNQAFEVRLWREGQVEHYGAAEPVRATSITVDLASAYAVQQGGSGRYFWTVAVVEVNPYRRIGAEAPARTLYVEQQAGPPPTNTPKPEPTNTPKP